MTAEDALRQIREAMDDPYKRRSLQNAIWVLQKIQSILDQEKNELP